MTYIDTLLLTGGFGTRLYPITMGGVVKPNLELLNKPLARVSIENYANQGRRGSLCLPSVHWSRVFSPYIFGYEVETVDGRKHPIYQFCFADTGRKKIFDDVSDGDAVSLALRHDERIVHDKPLLIAMGDPLEVINIRDLERYHKQMRNLHGTSMTFCYTLVDPLESKEYGRFVLEDGMVVKTVGKGEDHPSLIANIAVALIEPELYQRIIEKNEYMLGQGKRPVLYEDLLFGLLIDGFNAAAYEVKDWTDVGRPSSVLRLTSDVLNRGPFSSLFDLRNYEMLDSENYTLWVNRRIAGDLRRNLGELHLEGPILIGESLIQPGANITGPVVIGHNCVVCADTEIGSGPYRGFTAPSILQNWAKVGPGSIITGGWVGYNSDIVGTTIQPGSIVGNGIKIYNQRLSTDERVASLADKTEVVGTRKYREIRDLTEDLFVFSEDFST